MNSRAFVLAFVCGTFAAMAFGKTIYVSPEGGGDGTSPDSPKTLPEGVAAAEDGDVIKLLSGRGEYVPSKLNTSQSAYLYITKTITIEGDVDDPSAVVFNCQSNSEYRVFRTTKPITLRGFTVKDFYNAAENPAILWADTFSSGTATVEKCNFLAPTVKTKWNARVMHIAPGEDGVVHFKDCLFRDGYTDGTASTYNSGIYHNGGTLIVEGCMFTNMYSISKGTAIFSSSSAKALYVKNGCVFSGCSEAQSGGSTPSIGGGAIYSDCGFARISDATFENCSTLKTAGYGSAIRFTSTSLDAEVTDCDFANCTSVGRGTVSQYGGRMTVCRCSFVGNTSLTGGAISSDLSGSQTFVYDCSFVGNSSTQNDWPSNTQPGGTVFLAGLTNEVVRCAFTNNSAKACGGAILVVGTTTNPLPNTFIDSCSIIATTNDTNNEGRGGSIYFYPSAGSFVVRNTLFVDNYAANNASPGIRVRTSGPSVLIDNCTIVGSRSTATGAKGAPLYLDSAATIRNCIFWDNQLSNGTKTGLNVSGAKDYSNIAYDFATAPAGERHVPLTVSPFVGEGDYTLAKKVSDGQGGRVANPCLGAGLKLDWMTADSKDLAGNPRLREDDLVDLGCYEYFVKSGLLILVR